MTARIAGFLTRTPIAERVVMSNHHPPPAQPTPPEPTPTDPDRPTDPTPDERDVGYSQSHGYGPGHGGPSGPGDAPSKQAATVVPIEPDEPAGDVDE
jgi:hypothetical protein